MQYTEKQYYEALRAYEPRTTLYTCQIAAVRAFVDGDDYFHDVYLRCSQNISIQ